MSANWIMMSMEAAERFSADFRRGYVDAFLYHAREAAPARTGKGPWGAISDYDSGFECGLAAYRCVLVANRKEKQANG